MGLRSTFVLLLAFATACGSGAPSGGETTQAPTTATESRPIETTVLVPETTTTEDVVERPAQCPLDKPEVIEAGEALFATKGERSPGCSECHRVNSPSPRIGDPFGGPALVGVMDRHSEVFVRDQIMNGGGLMAPRGPHVGAQLEDDLSCTQLDQIIAYLYAIGPGDVVSNVDFDLDPIQVEAGAGVFEAVCSVCHLDGGRSPGEGQAFEPQPPELIDVFGRHTRVYVVRMINDGRGNMPSYREQLSVEDTNALVAYLRSLTDE